MYALCLDDCRAVGRFPFQQIEIEYNGKLCLPIDQLIDSGWLSFQTQFLAAKRLSKTQSKAAARCAERALLLAPQTDPPPPDKQQSEMNQVLEATQSLDSHQSPHISKHTFKQIEREILDEMRIILEHLINHEGCEMSVKTKRSWLKGEPKNTVNKLKYNHESDKN